MSKAYIDRINVFGFKSYGLRKLSIPVGDGFVGIVGPNGSGKSNIGDSIVFALGLATAKSMRALKLSDLIFSSKGKSAPYAEVEIIFKNEGAFPLNDEEVSIYRKVEHNGKSTYKINGRPAKQYEVEELLSMAGIPKQGYNIVTQGDIFKFIRMTPAERRDLISEIAGITEYEEKKAKALKDLEETEEKLSAAKMVLKEVENNLKRLEEERENALKAKEIENQIKEIENQIKGVKLFTLLKEKKEVEELLSDIEEKIQKLYNDKEKSIENQKKLLIEIKKLEEKLDKIQQSLLPIKEKEGQITAQIRTYNEKIKELEQQIKEAQENLANLNKEKEEKIKEILSIEEQIKSLKEHLPQIEEELKKAERQLELKNNQIKEIEIGGSKARLNLGQIESEEKKLKDEKAELEKQIIRLQNQLENTLEKIHSYKEQINTLTEEIDKLRKKEENILLYTKEREKKLTQLQSEINRLRIRKDALEKKILKIREKRDENFKKLTEILVKLQHVREDKNYSLIKDIPGVYGKVADLISIKDDELLTAIESAGGNRLNNVVVEDDKVAEECVKILREKQAGRLTFIPLNKIRVPTITRPPFRKGVLGLALDFIEYPSKIEKAVKYVFGDTVVVEDFDSARGLGISAFRMVTLDGDIFERSGTITGGAAKQNISLGKGTLEAEKEKLEKEDDRLKLEETAIEEELTKIENQLKEKEKEIYKLQTEAEGILLRKKEIENSISAYINKINVLENEIVNLKKNQFEIENQLEILNKKLETISDKLSQVEERKKEILKTMEDEGLHQLRKEWEELTKKVYALKEKKKDIQSKIETLNDKLENYLKIRIFQIENEKLKLEDKIKTNEEEINHLKEKIENESKNLTNLWQGLKDKEKEKEDLQSEIQHLRQQIKKYRDEEEKINKQITFLLEDKGKLEQKLEILRQEIENIQQEYIGEPIEGNLKELEKTLKKLQEKRQSIGAINEKALEDFKVVKDRFEDLSNKVQKLIEEKRSVEELIENLEEKKLNAFMDVYSAVNKNLGKIFKRLSPGGKAYLEIENEKDPLSGGILLKAKPRGKDVKRLEIMSGGEKTLTALAFLFAVQQYRPAPFYYFDEVDAHLDDANARKIAELMKELSKEAQFIVVTLRDTMASYADRLIGVSAREGISSVYTLDMKQILDNNNIESVGS